MKLSMLEKLIIYFVYKTKGHIIKTQLVKFLYLADLGAVKWQDKQLTDIDWRYYLQDQFYLQRTDLSRLHNFIGKLG